MLLLALATWTAGLGLVVLQLQVHFPDGPEGLGDRVEDAGQERVVRKLGNGRGFLEDILLEGAIRCGQGVYSVIF